MRRGVTVGIAALGAFLMAIGVAFAGESNLVRNGSFELPDVGTDPFFQEFGVGDTIATASQWRVVRGTVDVVADDLLEANSGSQSLDLNGSNSGAIEQTLEATVGGDDYLLSFYVAANPTCEDGVKVLRVFWNGERVATFRIDPEGEQGSTDPMDLNWQYRALELTAEDATTVLRFSSKPGDSNCGPMLDTVTVVASEV